MIFKLTFDDKREFVQAKNQLHLLQSYEKEYGEFQEIREVTEISDEEAKTIMLTNTDYDEDDPGDMPEKISLEDMVCGDDFCILASTEWPD